MRYSNVERQKIVFIINQFFRGGAETALLYLLSSLSPKKYEIDLIIYDHISSENSISLLSELPAQIHAVYPRKILTRYSFSRVLNKAISCFKGKTYFPKEIRDYLKDKKYNIAISYGEWFSSALVAKYVIAKRKYMWIHSDLDKSYTVHLDFYRYHSFYDGFFFASTESMNSAIRSYPFLKSQSTVVHNMVLGEYLKQLSLDSVSFPLLADGLPVFVTVANIRKEKNHLRQLQAMKILWEKGYRFYWINIGSTADTTLTHDLEKEIKRCQLEDYFHIAGAMKNPYPLIRKADAVCVLSDYESWSMVITEAKTLGVPVIATKTSGALEQIENGVTGVLCDFSVTAISEALESFFVNPALFESIRERLKSFSPESDTLKGLEPLLQNHRKKVLYIFDDINYKSGAQQAAFSQVNYLRTNCEVSLFSISACKDQALLQKIRVVGLENQKLFPIIAAPCRQVLAAKNIERKYKILRIIYAILRKLYLSDIFDCLLLRRTCSQLMENYDSVCVVSESSQLRWQIGELHNPKKIQWIHTDYAAWRYQTKWTKNVTKHDEKIYKKYDVIVCLSERLKQRFVSLYPALETNVIAVPNLIDEKVIQKKAAEPCHQKVDCKKFNIITIGRMEMEKNYDLLLQVAKELKEKRFSFHWYFVGSGSEFSRISYQCNLFQLSHEITLTGNLENPYPLLKQCDLFVLLSKYEGTPVTIDEAKVLGVPVLANDVGGIADQITQNDGVVLPLGKMDPVVQIIQMSYTRKERENNFPKEISSYNLHVQKKLAALFE